MRVAPRVRTADPRRLLKPHFIADPGLVVRRARAEVRQRRARQQVATVRHAVGVDITTATAGFVGSSLVRLGFSDLCVSESLLRLADPGEVVMDAGANVGAMTAVLAFAVGPGGRVVCCEPQEAVLEHLRVNVARWALDARLGEIEVREVALGSSRGTARLGIFDETGNPGSARLQEGDGQGEAVAVSVIDEPLTVLKLDIEGSELAALRGAAPLLRAGMIRDIVFEDFEFEEHGRSDVADLLRSHDYDLLRLGIDRRGMVCESVTAPPSFARGYEPPSFLATRDPDRALRRMHSRGFGLVRANPPRS